MPAPKGHPPYPGCEKGGRPKKWTDREIEKLADEFLQWMAKPTSFWFKDFALEKGIIPKRFAEWAKCNEKFGFVYQYAQEWQTSKLLRLGLVGKFNASLVKLVLFNTAGWSDKQHVSGDAANPLAFVLRDIDGDTKDLVYGQSGRRCDSETSAE